jgi:hypothetical protein
LPAKREGGKDRFWIGEVGEGEKADRRLKYWMNHNNIDSKPFSA